MKRCGTGPCFVYFYTGDRCPSCGERGDTVSPNDQLALAGIFNSSEARA